MATVTNTVKHFAESGIDGIITLKCNVNLILQDASWMDAQKPVSSKSHASLYRRGIRCTLRLLEDQAKIVLDTLVSKDTIGRALKNKPRPHMNAYWCIPSKEDAEFVACMEDVLDVYEFPLIRRVLLLAWSKSHISC